MKEACAFLQPPLPVQHYSNGLTYYESERDAVRPIIPARSRGAQWQPKLRRCDGARRLGAWRGA